ncbi:MAG: phosphoribosylglycinamide formyltransferase [Kiloniellales bacterium]
MARLKLGVLISGRGSNLQALIDAALDPAYPAEIVLVISNRPGVEGLERARRAGLTRQLIDHHDFAGREAFEAALTTALEAASVELVCLAGFMRVLTQSFVTRWWDRLINIHPSLLPAFPGLDTHRRALEAGVRFAGCTVHFVRPGLDDGPIIVQAAVPVQEGDSADSLAARVLKQEHRIYPLAVRLIADGRVRVVDRQVVIDGAAAPVTALINPQI